MAASRHIFHITSGKNLRAILSQGGLCPKNVLSGAGADYESIAYTGIQDRRAKVQVPISSGGNLHDYVPFYFCARSPMLFAIHRGRVEGAPTQRAILHLRSSTQAVVDAGKEWAFTDGHAAMTLTEFHDDLNELDSAVDWSVVNSKSWGDTEEDGDRKRRKQAEFLVRPFVDWELIDEVGVTDSRVRDRVLEIIGDSGKAHTPTVAVRSHWYY